LLGGLVVILHRSKTDQLGAGREVPIPYLRTESLCPARAVRAWIDAAAIIGGPLFRTFSLPHRRSKGTAKLTEQRIDGRDVARLVQAVARRAGIDGDFGAHSLRAGFVTSGAARSVSEASLQAVTGHRSTAILRNYVRRATLFDDAALPRIMGEGCRRGCPLQLPLLVPPLLVPPLLVPELLLLIPLLLLLLLLLYLQHQLLVLLLLLRL
jgi:hypothetical protein